MPEITAEDCSLLLAQFFLTNTNDSLAKAMAKKLGIKHSLFWGGKKQLNKVLEELAILHSALVIDTVNCTFEEEACKAVIDPFLAKLKKSFFSQLESKNKDFKKNYEKHINRYFKDLTGENPGLGLSFSFIENIGLNPLRNLQGQLFLVSYLHEAKSRITTILGSATIVQEAAITDPFREFEEKMEDWPEKEAYFAVKTVKTIITGDNEEYEKLWPQLTLNQMRVIAELMERLEDSSSIERIPE